MMESKTKQQQMKENHHSLLPSKPLNINHIERAGLVAVKRKLKRV